MDTIRIIIADDHGLMRAGVRSMLEDMPGVDVLAEAKDGRQALELVKQHHPDIVLLDIAMPGINGLDAAARMAEESPGTAIVILSMHQDEEYVRRAIKSGVRGYLLKNADIGELEIAIRAIAAGGDYLSPAVSRQVVNEYREKALAEDPVDELTPRQREILRMIAQGATTKAIAYRLGLSIKTVETHRSQLMDRLDIHEIAGLVRYAIRIGLISPED